jgi:hypothetical protein
MDMQQSSWELLILDADPGTKGLGCLTVGDVDGDGHPEIVTGGARAAGHYEPRPDGCQVRAPLGGE